MADAVRAEEIADQRSYLIAFPCSGRMDPVQETAERGRELTGLILWRLISHGPEPPASVPLPAAEHAAELTDAPRRRLAVAARASRNPFLRLPIRRKQGSAARLANTTPVGTGLTWPWR